MDATNVIKTLTDHRSELEQFKVKDLWMFGSASRGEMEVGDIDLLVEFTTPPTLVEFVELKEYLQHLLSLPIDLVSKRGCNDRFLEEIAADLRHVA